MGRRLDFNLVEDIKIYYHGGSGHSLGGGTIGEMIQSQVHEIKAYSAFNVFTEDAVASAYRTTVLLIANQRQNGTAVFVLTQFSGNDCPLPKRTSRQVFRLFPLLCSTDWTGKNLG